MKKFAVVLSGCGVFDGTEIHEAVMSLYAIDKNGAQYEIFAPNIEQHHVINHLTKNETNEKRNVLVESARIARGKINDLNEFDPNKFDALLFPGGFGVAKNLSDFAFEGDNYHVAPIIEKTIKSMHKLSKPIGALCIAPAILAKTIPNVELTIGNDINTSRILEKVGAKHMQTKHGEVVIDKKNKVVTTPCYMLDSTISQIATGADNVVKTMLQLM